MTNDEIIRMALDAGFPKRLPEFYAGCFEKMIIASYKQGRDDEISRVYEAYVDPVLAEREACAKLMDDMAAKDNLSNYYKVAANKIRARGQE
jgi:hypothetical protein